jgi:hypothetical protein
MARPFEHFAKTRAQAFKPCMSLPMINAAMPARQWSPLRAGWPRKPGQRAAGHGENAKHRSKENDEANNGKHG